MPTGLSTGNHQLLSAHRFHVKNEANSPGGLNPVRTDRLPDRFDEGANKGAWLGKLNQPKQKMLFYGFTKALKEMGFKQLSSVLSSGEGSIDLSLGLKAKLKFSENQHKPNDRYILQDDVRKQVSVEFKRKHRDIVWVETVGVVGLDETFKQKDSFHKGVSGKTEEKISSKVSYRRLEPFESPSGTVEKGVAAYQSLIVPTKALLAKKMVPGSEFEIILEGHTFLKPEIECQSGDYLAGPVSGSVKANVGIESDILAGASILVQKLKKKNCVLVKVSSASGVVSTKFARLVSKLSSSFSLPQYWQRVVHFAGSFLGTIGLGGLERKLQGYEAKLMAENSKSNTKQSLKRYVFDLSKPKAQTAYNELFNRLSTLKADKYATKSDSGVKSQRSIEDFETSKTSYEALIGESSISSYQNIEDIREERLVGGMRKNIVYRESKFEKTYKSWLYGVKKVVWDSVVLHDEVTKKNEHYYHLVYSDENRYSPKQTIEKFFKFVRAVGVRPFAGKQLDRKDIICWLETLARKERVVSVSDFFFKDRGIKRIKSASSSELLFNSYKVAQAMGKKSVALPFLQGSKQEINLEVKSYQMLERYMSLQQKSFWTKWWVQDEINQIEDEYLTVFKENLSDVAEVATRAQRITKHLEGLKHAENSQDVRKFFSKLGKTKGFDFAETVATMIKVAGHKDTIIHDLAINAGGLSVRHKNEGRIVHPASEVTEELASWA